MKRWADELLAFQGLNKPPEAILKISQQALIDFRAYIGELIRERRRTPRADLLSSLVAAEAEGDKLTEQELTYTCITLLVAANRQRPLHHPSPSGPMGSVAPGAVAARVCS